MTEAGEVKSKAAQPSDLLEDQVEAREQGSEEKPHTLIEFAREFFGSKLQETVDYLTRGRHVVFRAGPGCGKSDIFIPAVVAEMVRKDNPPPLVINLQAPGDYAYRLEDYYEEYGEAVVPKQTVLDEAENITDMLKLNLEEIEDEYSRRRKAETRDIFINSTTTPCLFLIGGGEPLSAAQFATDLNRLTLDVKELEGGGLENIHTIDFIRKLSLDTARKFSQAVEHPAYVVEALLARLPEDLVMALNFRLYSSLISGLENEAKKLLDKIIVENKVNWQDWVRKDHTLLATLQEYLKEFPQPGVTSWEDISFGKLPAKVKYPLQMTILADGKVAIPDSAWDEILIQKMANVLPKPDTDEMEELVNLYPNTDTYQAERRKVRETLTKWSKYYLDTKWSKLLLG